MRSFAISELVALLLGDRKRRLPAAEGGPAQEAIAPLRKSLQLHQGDAPLVGVQLAQVLLPVKDPEILEDEGNHALAQGRPTGPDNATAYNSA